MVVIIQARVGSTRLPGKVLEEVEGKPLWHHVWRRASRAKSAQATIMAIPWDKADDQLAASIRAEGVVCFRGPGRNVLRRYYLAARAHKADVVVRITADCPFVAGEEIDRVVAFYRQHNLQYASNCHPPYLPDGLDVEVFSTDIVEWADATTEDAGFREHVTPALRARLPRLWWRSLDYAVDLSRYRLTVDEAADLEVTRRLYALGGPDMTWREAIWCLDSHRDLRALNQHLPRNAGAVNLPEEVLFARST